MLMNDELSVDAEGGINFSDFTIRKRINVEGLIFTGYLNLCDGKITIFFESRQQITEFCEKHNIVLFDESKKKLVEK